MYGCAYGCGYGRGCGFVDSKGTGYLGVSMGVGVVVGVSLQTVN